MIKRIGVLTGGGDCPGLNAVIAAATRTLNDAGVQTVGLLEGWRGPIEGNTCELDRKNTAHIIGTGGTILGTSRTNPYKKEGAVAKIKENFKKLGLDALIAIGGEDTLGVATKLYGEEKLPVIGVPKTIDNDLSATDFTFGFDTAVNIAMEAVDRVHTTAASHRRCLVVEVMGRHAGWIAAYAGICGDADVTLVPEMKANVDEIAKTLKANRAAGKKYNIIVVSEGVEFEQTGMVTQEKELDAFGHVRLGGVGDNLAKMIEKATGYETRSMVLGHLQRGGSPTAFDRMLGTRFGVKAGQMVLAKDWGKMAALRGNEIVAVPLKDATGVLKVLNDDFKSLVKLFSK
jgi:ATP-dependent phosphofructokinase / diphosphate-dependent phosphofructokinase